VDCALGTVAGGIANIVEELQGVHRNATKDGRGQSRSTTVRVEADCVNVGTSNPTEWQQGVSHSQVGDMVDVVKTPICPKAQPHPEPVVTPSTELNRPILVDLDSLSNHNAYNNAAAQGTNKTSAPNLKRTHCQPRLRAVPCAKQLLAGAANATAGEASSGGIPKAIPHAQRYKDHPGYENLRDFGEGEESSLRPPALQPKNHGVSEHLTLEENAMKFPRLFGYYLLTSANMVFFCADSSPTWNTMLGAAPWLQLPGCGRSQGWCQ
jgi:hypothetical protein